MISTDNASVTPATSSLDPLLFSLHRFSKNVTSTFIN